MNNDTECSPTVTNCIFSGNSAGYGGGMSNYDLSDPRLINCTFTGNTATVGGGGMHNYYLASPSLTNCSFIGNDSGDRGGGMYSESSCDSTITDCTFTDNSAGDGGGIYNKESDPVLTGCTFTDNSANNYGGGMYNSGNDARVVNCSFSSNIGGSGGGICNEETRVIITNSKFIFNIANSDDGGGIFNLGGSPTVTNCTFTGNEADDFGAAISNIESSPTISNCIMWGDRFDEIYVDGGTPIFRYCDIQGGWEGEGNIDVDPLFIDADGLDDIAGTEDDNLRLLPWSPCIDVGDNSVVEPDSTDLDGNPRIINGIVDMGAYEAPVSIEADVHIVPRVINRNNHLKRAIAIVQLPDGISKRDVADEPFMLYAGDSEGIEATWQRVVGWGRRASVFALFDKAQLMDAVEYNGRIELTVVGKLTSGQYIYGSDTVRVAKPRRRRPRWWHKR